MNDGGVLTGSNLHRWCKNAWILGNFGVSEGWSRNGPWLVWRSAGWTLGRRALGQCGVRVIIGLGIGGYLGHLLVSCMSRWTLEEYTYSLISFRRWYPAIYFSFYNDVPYRECALINTLGCTLVFEGCNKLAELCIGVFPLQTTPEIAA